MNCRRIIALMIFVTATVALLLPQNVRAEMETYMIDKVHSMANFKIGHLFSKVSGTFSEVTGTVWVDRDNLKESRVDATINVHSIDTNNVKRDTHLRSEDFFYVEKYPIIRFVSTAVEVTGENQGVMSGELTMHGVTRSVKLPFTVLGFGPDPWGGYRGGFEATTVLKRTDYGIDYGFRGKGGSAVGDEVEINLLIEGVKLGPEGAPFRVQ